MEKWPETYWKRPIPTAHWQGVSLLTGLLVIAFLIGWESYWRLNGYEPGMEETAELWLIERNKVTPEDRNEVVLLGSSRVAFDIDLDVWEQDSGGIRPTMLARVGTNPYLFLKELSEDETFKGTIICGVTPGLFFTPDAAPTSLDVKTYLKHMQGRSRSAYTDHLLSIPLESAFASLNKEDLSLRQLLMRHAHLANREGAHVMPPMPPYFARITRDRRYHMWSRMEHDPAIQEYVQQIWMPLFQLAPPFGGEGLDYYILSVKEMVDKLEARGARIVFVRCPSTGDLLELERKTHPREAYWDRLLAETGAPGIHYEDFPELSGYDCPEWSHLTRSDAVTFTRGLIPHVDRLLGR